MTAPVATSDATLKDQSVSFRLRRLGQSPSSSGASSLHTSAQTSASSRRDHDLHDVESCGTKNVVVLGGSYGGLHAATELAQKLPPTHRVILVERNSHFNHLYVFPRFSVLGGHEHKAFIPYTNIFGMSPRRRSKTLQQRGRQLDFDARSGSVLRPEASNAGSADGMADSAESRESADSTRSALRLLKRSNQDRSASASSTDHSNSSTTDSLLRTRTQEDLNSSTSWTSEEAEMDAGNKAMEKAIVKEGAESAEINESLGRPPVKFETVADAIKDGLGEHPAEERSSPGSDAEDDCAQGFEDAAPHVVLQATVTSITDTHVVVTPSTPAGAPSKKLWSIDSLSIPYTHLVYALGSHLPDPLRTVARSKAGGISWMTDVQTRIKKSERIVLVGGGALGVEFASDIKSLYPEKDVTLIHSRKQLLPNFDSRIHEAAKATLEELGVRLVLGERLALTEGCPKGSTTALDPEGEERDHADAPLGSHARPHPIRKPSDALHAGLKRVRTTGGKEFICDLLMLCTGQQPNSGLMASLSPTSVDPHSRLIRVLPTLQVALPPPEEAAPGPFDARPPCGDCDCFLDKKAAGASLDERQRQHLEDHGEDADSVTSGSSNAPGRIHNVYAIGDCADAFGALNAGYQAWGMAGIAAENIIRDIGWASDTSFDAASEPSLSSSSASSESSISSPTNVRAQPVEMMHFSPAPNLLKLSLGLGKMVMQGSPVEHEEDCQVTGQPRKVLKPEVACKSDPHDLGVEGVWGMVSAPTHDLYL